MAVWATFLAVGAIIVFLNRDRHSYRGNGWIESASGTWLCFSIVYCLYRALDRTNYRRRRLWYGIAVLVLALGYHFFDTSPSSFAVILILMGTTPIIFGLLDLGLLFRFASTSVPKCQRKVSHSASTGKTIMDRIRLAFLPEKLSRRSCSISWTLMRIDLCRL